MRTRVSVCVCLWLWLCLCEGISIYTFNFTTLKTKLKNHERNENFRSNKHTERINHQKINNEKRIDRNRDSALFLLTNVSSYVFCMLCIVYFIENTKSWFVGLWQASNCRRIDTCVCVRYGPNVDVCMWACVWVRAGYSNINSNSNSSYRVAISYTRTYYHMHKYNQRNIRTHSHGEYGRTTHMQCSILIHFDNKTATEAAASPMACVYARIQLYTVWSRMKNNIPSTLANVHAYVCAHATLRDINVLPHTKNIDSLRLPWLRAIHRHTCYVNGVRVYVCTLAYAHTFMWAASVWKSVCKP